MIPALIAIHGLLGMFIRALIAAAWKSNEARKTCMSVAARFLLDHHAFCGGLHGRRDISFDLLRILRYRLR